MVEFPVMNVRQIHLNSSTADIEKGPQVIWEEFGLRITFNDYLNQPVALLFNEVPHFKLLSSDEPRLSSLQDDSVFEVLSSELIESLTACGELDAETDFKHWLIGFNEIGTFVEVIFQDFEEQI